MASANQPTLKTYQFVATSVEQHAPLRLEIDCVNDMEASMMALRFVSREHAVDVWSNGYLIYHAPAITQHEPSFGTAQEVSTQSDNEIAHIASEAVSIMH